MQIKNWAEIKNSVVSEAMSDEKPNLSVDMQQKNYRCPENKIHQHSVALLSKL